MCPLIKRLGGAFISKRATEPLKCYPSFWNIVTETPKHRVFQKLGQAFEGFRESLKLGRKFEKLCLVFVL